MYFANPDLTYIRLCRLLPTLCGKWYASIHHAASTASKRSICIIYIRYVSAHVWNFA